MLSHYILPSRELRGLIMFQHNNAPVHKSYGLPRLEWKNSSNLQKHLTSIPPNTFGMNWPIAPHGPSPKSLLDLTNTLVADWAKPHSHALKCSGKHSQTNGGYSSSKDGPKSGIGCSNKDISFLWPGVHKPLVL